MSLSIIAAVGAKRELGKKGGLCFNIPNDMKFFRKTTMGHPVFMGLSTWYSLPGRLKGRDHYVAVFERTELPDFITQVTDIQAFAKEWAEKEEELFVIGGASIYAQMLPYCDKLYLTEVEAEDPEAEVFFPRFNKRNYHRKTVGRNSDGDLSYKHVVYTKKASPKQ